MKLLLNDIDLANEEYIVVGVSTGADSMALLHLLSHNLNKKIVIAHINHNVRKESLKEEQYIIKYAKDNNIIIETRTITEYTENNFENEARNKRYTFFEEVLKKYNSKHLFLAHHADDLIETILMKISRGSNLMGYAGFKYISKPISKDYYIIRPLIYYTKEEILEYIESHNITYYSDITNNDIQYTRNWYRKKIIPLLKQENKLIHEKFLTFSNTLNEYDEYIKKIVIEHINKIYKNNILDIDKFNKLDLFIKKNILYYILDNLYDNENNIVKNKHVTDIIKLIENEKPNLNINLPKNKLAIKEYNKLVFKDNLNNDKEYDIILQDYNVIDEHIIKVIDNIESDGNDICRLNTNNISLPLHIRNKKVSDIMYIKGMNGSKKIKDIFIDSKIPLSKRSNYPIITDNEDNILWIPNIKKSKFNINKNENYDIILKYEKGGNI